ncbi:glycoside hydrolase family 3 protein, partial [Lentinula novae-zelandiae]
MKALICRCVGNISPLLNLIHRLGNEHHHLSLCFNDGPAGIRLGGSNVTGFPAAINVAATFNRDLMYSRGGGYASAFYLDPDFDILYQMRNPKAGRAWESFGPDPYLGGEGLAYKIIMGVQSGGAAATPERPALYTAFDPDGIISRSA